MANDYERREVAERLRGLNGNVSHVRRVYEAEGLSIFCDDQADYYQICDAVAGYLPAEHMHPCDYEELHARLADLIEPSDAAKCVAEVKVDGEKLEKLVHDAVAECAGVDREALLALADRASKLGDEEESGVDSFAVRCTFRVFARRIREACGEAGR